MRRIAVATQTFQLPIRTALQLVSSLPGVSGVRIDARSELRPGELSQTGKRELLHFLKETGLEITALSFPTRRAFYDLEELDRRVSAARDAMDLAAALKVRHLCLRVGKIPDSADSREFGLLVETLTDLARHGNRIGVTLTISPGGESLDTITQLLAQIRSGPIAIDFDPTRLLLSPTPLVTLLRGLHAYVEQFTARDGARDFSGGVEETALGRGEVVWDELLATLGEADYRGSLTVQRAPGENRQPEVERAVRFLQQIVGEM